MKVRIKNQQRRTRINLRKLRRDSLSLLKAFDLKQAELGISLVNDRRMKDLNLLYRGIDKTTDVLSFPQLDSKELRVTGDKLKNKTSLPVSRYPLLLLGDIVINLRAAERQSSIYGLAFGAEVRRLLIHGFLHLLGYDHERGPYQERKMKKKEAELIRAIETLD